MRNFLKMAWHQLLGPTESQYMQALHYLREQNPQIYQSRRPAKAPRARGQVVTMAFLAVVALVAWAWIAHFLKVKPQ